MSYSTAVYREKLTDRWAGALALASRYHGSKYAVRLICNQCGHSFYKRADEALARTPAHCRCPECHIDGKWRDPLTGKA